MNKITQSNRAGLLAIVALFAIVFVAAFTFVPTAQAGYSFGTNLKQGSSGNDVKELQKLLNMNASTQVSTSGAGAPGQESTYFGAKTKAAVIKFQNMYASEVLAPAGLSSGTGFVGALTRAKLNAMSGGVSGSTSTIPGCTSTAGFSPTTGQKCDAGTTTTIPSTGGSLQVSAASQPANALAVTSANRVPFTRVVLSAGSNDVTVNNITVERVGPAVDGVFSGVALLDENGTQIGVSKTFNSNHQVSVGDPITIRAGQTRTLTIAGNMSSSLSSYAGQVVGIQVNAVNTNGTVSGSLPVVGAMHTINASLTIGSATYAVSTFDPNSAQNKEIGTTNYKFAGIRITAGSAEQVRLRSIRWNQTGSAGSGDLANVKTYVDGVAYDTSIDATGKYYTAIFGSGIVIDKGLSKDVYVQADIVGTNAAARTVSFEIYKNTDIYLTGETYGYGITGTAGSTGSATTASEFTTGTPFYSASVITVTAGSVTSISKATSVASQNIAVNVPGQVLGGFDMDLKGEPISVQNHIFRLFTSAAWGTTNLMTNITLYGPNGQVVAGPVDAVTDGAQMQKVTFTDTITYPIGKGTYTLKGKLPSTGPSNGDTVTASTTPSSDWSNITGQTTGNTISLSGLSTAVTFNQMTVKSAALAVTISTDPAAQTIVAGGQQRTFANYQFDASQSGEDVRFSSLTLTLAGTGATTALSACQLYDGATALNTGSNVVNPDAATEAFTLDNSLTITKGTVKTLALKCNVSSTASGTYQWGITTSSTNPTVTGVTSSNSVTATGGTLIGQVLTIGSGTLVVSTDSSSPSYTVASGGTTNVVAGVAKFRASNQAVNLDRVGLVLSNSASSSAADLVRVTLWDGGTQVGTATFTGSSVNATSTLTQTVLLPKDTDKTLTIKADLADIGSSLPGGEGRLIAINVDVNTNTKGTGVDSGTQINATGSTAFAGIRTFNSYPTLSLDSLNASGVADGRLMRFKVTADSANSVSLAQFKINLATTSATVSNVNIYGFTDSAYSQGVSGVGSGGQVRDSHINTGTAALPYTIAAQQVGGTATSIVVPAGTTRYFEVRGTVTGSATTYSVTTTLQGDSSYPSTTCAGTPANCMNTVSGAAGSFVWSPNATTTPNVTTDNDWTNGYGLPGLPSNGLIQTRSN